MTKPGQAERRSFPSLPSLQEKLDAITARTRSLVQADRLAISEDAAAQLFGTGIESRVLAVGESAPVFALQDAETGRIIRSEDLLSLGPVVVKFFRGRWDPYCMTELEAWRDLVPKLRECGALLVAVSPQTRRQNDFTVQQHGLGFPVLSDPECALAERFGLAHLLPAAEREYYRSILVNIPHANSGGTYENAPESAWRLPLAGLFLIQPDGGSGRIAFREAHADPRVRPEPEELFEVLSCGGAR